MDILKVVNIFLTTVEGLMRTRLSGDRRIYMETKEGRHINFKPKSFKKKLQEVAGENLEARELLKYFRTLNWIITGNEDRFSNTQRINNKVMRVITVDREVLETLKDLTWQKRKDK